MDNSFLLQKLVEGGVVSRDQAAKLQSELGYLKLPVDKVIHDRRLAEDQAVAEVKAEILGVPFKRVSSKEITDELLHIIPEETVLNYGVLPLSRDKENLVVGMVNPDETQAQDALRFIAKKLQVNLGVYLISIGDFEAIAKRYSPYKNEIEAAVKSIKGAEQQMTSAQRVVQLDEGAALSEEAPVIKIVSSTLQEAVDQRASDIHVEPQRNRLRIRFRVDGDLKEVADFPLQLHRPIVARIKVLSELKIDETRVPQDGRFRTMLSGRDIDFRVATFPTPVGEKVVLRILDPTVGLKGLDQLGLSTYNINIINQGIERPFGMILVSGPTGSGKTTTLYGILQVLNKNNVNIVSLEDPVEYFIDGMNQSQVRPEIGYTFANGLRQILRQDPDVIMVGEIRDGETAELAVHAALTGHIVLSTIHTNDAISVVPRLLDLGVQKFLLPSALNLMAAQRLLRKLCPYCRTAVKSTAEVDKIINETIETLPSEVKKQYQAPYSVYKSEGCAKCNNKGTIGRVAIFEVLTMTDNLADLLAREGFATGKMKEEAKRQGMLTLRQDGVLKALKGEVRIEEVLRETK